MKPIPVIAPARAVDMPCAAIMPSTRCPPDQGEHPIPGCRAAQVPLEPQRIGERERHHQVDRLQWKKDVAQHDYAAAASYLSIRFGENRTKQVVEELRKLPVITRRANDILRATRRDPLPLSDPGVLKDLKKVLGGEELSPILVAEADIADGYHRLSLAYALDPYTEVPLKLGGVPAP